MNETSSSYSLLKEDKHEEESKGNGKNGEESKGNGENGEEFANPKENDSDDVESAATVITTVSAISGDRSSSQSPGISTSDNICLISESETHSANFSPTPTSCSGLLTRFKQEATGFPHFYTRVYDHLFNSVPCTAILLLALTVPAIPIIVGSHFLHDCPSRPAIPIVLMVGGSVMALAVYVNLLEKLRRFRHPSFPRWRPIGAICHLLDCFLLIWFITACYFVFGKGKPSYSVGDSNYCDHTLFLFAIGVMIASAIILTMIIVFVFIILYYYCCLTTAQAPGIAD